MIKGFTVPKQAYFDDILSMLNKKMVELNISDDQIIGVISNSYNLETLVLYKEGSDTK